MQNSFRFWVLRCKISKLLGLTRLYTQTRGFIPITYEKSIYRWIGKNKNEFFDNIRKSYNGEYKIPKIDWEAMGILTI